MKSAAWNLFKIRISLLAEEREVSLSTDTRSIPAVTDGENVIL
jgi:hypothetical protein